MDSFLPVNELSNSELAEELKSHGFFPGPIMGSTRKVYEKKLLKLRLSCGGDISQKDESLLDESISDPGYEEVPDDEESLPPPPPRVRKTPPRKAKAVISDNELKKRPVARKEDASESSMSGQPQAQVPVSEKAKMKKDSKGIPAIVKLLIFLAAAFFMYLVYINMEPGSKIPKSIGTSSGKNT